MFFTGTLQTPRLFHVSDTATPLTHTHTQTKLSQDRSRGAGRTYTHTFVHHECQCFNVNVTMIAHVHVCVCVCVQWRVCRCQSYGNLPSLSTNDTLVLTSHIQSNSPEVQVYELWWNLTHLDTHNPGQHSFVCVCVCMMIFNSTPHEPTHTHTHTHTHLWYTILSRDSQSLYLSPIHQKSLGDRQSCGMFRSHELQSV